MKTKIKYKVVIASTENENHLKILSLISMEDVPEKEYVFKAYDFSKYPSRGVSRENALKKIETTISFNAKTSDAAYDMKHHYKGKLTIGELIEIK